MSAGAHLDWFSSRGCSLVPLVPGEKHAAKGWRTNTYVRSQIEGHLALGNAVAWRLGETDLVIDVDLYKSGVDRPFALLNKHFGGSLSAVAPTVHTPSGGRHFYFRVPANTQLRGTSEVYGAHIEFKAFGGLAAAPPSPGYSFDYSSPLDAHIPQAPLWLVNHLTVSTPKNMPGSPSWSDETLGSVLSTLNASDFASHAEWWPILCASHYASNGMGVAPFLAWSMSDPTYSGDAGLVRIRWESLTTSAKPNYITHLSLLKTIRNKYGYLPPAAQEAVDASGFGVVDFGGVEMAQSNTVVPIPTVPMAGLMPQATPQLSHDGGGVTPVPIGDTDTGADYLSLDRKIKMLSPQSSTASILECIEGMARMDQIQQSRLIPALVKSTGMTRTDVRKYVTQSSKQRYAATANLGAREQSKEGDSDPVPADLGHYLAELVLHEYYDDGRRLMFAPEGQYWTYTGTHWSQRSDEQIDNTILKGAMRLRNDLSAAASITVAQLMSQARQIIRSISAGDQANVFDRMNPKSIINCKNGEVWVDEYTGISTFRAHSPSSGLSSCLNIEYDPRAKAPMWEKAVYGMFAPLVAPWEVVDHLHEVIGYTLQPTKNLAAWVLLYGGGSNGKSTVLDVLSTLIGEEAVLSIALDDFAKQSHIYEAVAGKLAVVEDDLKKGHYLPDDILKKMSESKILSANPKHKKYFSFRNTSTIWISSNHWPKTSDMSRGMRRRPYVFEFKRDFEADGTDDTNLKKKIIGHELSGVLNLSLSGLVRLRTRGKLERPDDCERVKERWMDNTNQVKRFFQTRFEHTPGKTVTLASAYQNYQVWCESEGIAMRLRKSRKGLDEELQSMGERVCIVDRSTQIVGVALKTEWA